LGPKGGTLNLKVGGQCIGRGGQNIKKYNKNTTIEKVGGYMAPLPKLLWWRHLCVGVLPLRE